MSIEPIIRDATAADVDAMSLLLGQLFSIEEDFIADPEKQRVGLQRLLESDQAKILVAEIEGRVIGMVTVQRLISSAEGGPVGFVEDLVVDEPNRNQGIGKALLDHLALWSEQNGLKRLQLLADRNNLPALGFYQKQGWVMTDLIGLRYAVLPCKTS